MRHSFATNANRASGAIRNSKPVRARKLGMDDWIEFPSTREASQVLGVYSGSISACLAGKQRQTGGYEFEEGTPVEPPRLDGEEWWDSRIDGGRVSSFDAFKAGVDHLYSSTGDGRVRQGPVWTYELLCASSGGRAFLPPPTPEHVYVNQGLDRSNNHVSNLEWSTISQNMLHSHATNAKRGSSAGRTAKPVRGRRRDSDEWTVYPGGANEAARCLGIHQGNVTAVCKGQQPSAGGYVFEYDAPTEEPLGGEVTEGGILEDRGGSILVRSHAFA